MVVSDGEQIYCGPEVSGDEPFLLSKQVPRAIVVVGKNRWSSGESQKERSGNLLYLLDDGFQHVQLQRDLDLLLIDAASPLSEMYPIPLGNLRERMDAIRRADAVGLTRAHLARNKLIELKASISHYAPGIPVFEFCHEATGLYDISTKEKRELADFKGLAIGALAAIGNPGQFMSDLERLHLSIKEKFIFRDHHPFSQDDLDKILTACKHRKLDAVITTEKDAVRLARLSIPDELFLALPIVVRNKDGSFDSWFLNQLTRIEQNPTRLGRSEQR
jgi:tetraacyldisaccharide 4'-kinase